MVKTIKSAGNEIEVVMDSSSPSSSSSSNSPFENFHRNYRSANSKVNTPQKSKTKSTSNVYTKLTSKFKSRFNSKFKSASALTLSLQEFEIPEKKVIIPLNYFENTTFIKSIGQIWKYRFKSSIILCGRWWRIICSHPLGIYFIVFPSITKQIYLNGYEGYRFFWWHKKTVIEKPYII
ncbi:hypothetical protein LY90DRAFT_699871 [Neocallimastix californiae]|uniref:Uncharacterized protein n=1 Tax=Neocallimastix californiae TaxID=1754190 RepID=A0A1Y2EMT5_9FUNG|nr:hypothetical protein LY90DRAFT_699871 [Neocallimastix californiae]|eukprot:ORY72863.1 hypothetical protein LY90DRAFT_699871 [Neocallimastix californiae]